MALCEHILYVMLRYYSSTSFAASTLTAGGAFRECPTGYFLKLYLILWHNNSSLSTKFNMNSINIVTRQPVVGRRAVERGYATRL